MRGVHLVILFLWVFCAQGQSFTNMNFAYGLDAVVVNSLFGSGISAVDFDQDGTDDLTYALNGEIKFFRNDELFCSELDLGVQPTGVVKQVIWVDIDNDQDLDLFFTQYNQPNKLYLNTGNLVMVDISDQSGLAEFYAPHFGCSWGDYDLDGDLDVFVCTYIYSYQGDDPYSYSNHLYENLGGGIFSDVTLNAGVSDGISVSFQSIWFDENLDGWPDLYVINDKEHPNRLYRNNLDGTFTELGESLGAAVALMDAMSASPGDYDNDGDLDLYISNTSIMPCQLLQKTDEGVFEDVAPSANLELNVLAWGGIWFDPDLDGDLDLYVCEHNYNFNQLPNPYMRNQGNGVFVNVAANSFPFDYSNSYSGAACDWNSDGYPDLAVSNVAEQNGSLWINQGGDKHFVSFDLEGVISNSKGIGAFINCWVNGQVQTRLVMCGENYLGQNTNRVTFGLGEALSVDSLKILWPSGHEDFYHQLDHGYLGTLVEGEGYTSGLEPFGEFYLCTGDTLVVTAGNHEEYLWSTGDTTQQITVFQSGSYVVTTMNAFGFEAIDSVIVSLIDLPIPESEIQQVSCSGANDGQVHFMGQADHLVIWEGNVIDSLIVNLEPGVYTFQIQDSLGCTFEDSLIISEPDLLELSLDELWCEEGLNALVSTVGGTPPYYWQWSDGTQDEDLYDVPDSLVYVLNVTDQNNCSAQLDNVECPLVHRAIAQKTSMIYPNPSNGRIHFQGVEEQLVRIVCSKGVIIIEEWIVPDQELDMRVLAPGIYFVHLKEGIWRIILN